jgi:hypothetical protein
MSTAARIQGKKIVHDCNNLGFAERVEQCFHPAHTYTLIWISCAPQTNRISIDLGLLIQMRTGDTTIITVYPCILGSEHIVTVKIRTEASNKT